MNKELIKIVKMTKHYPIGGGKFTALRDIDLEFEKGEFTGIVGPSGSGKTTLLNIIGSLDTQSEGDVNVMGNSIRKLSSKKAAKLRSQHIGLFFKLTIYCRFTLFLKMWNFL